MEQAIGDAPLLLAAQQGDGFVIQPQYPTATLFMVAIQETNHITDRDFVTPKSVPGLFTYFDIRPLKVDGSIRNQPAFLRGKVEYHRLLARKLQNLALLGAIGCGVEMLNRLANPQS